MNALGLLRTLGPVDLRNVRREPLLAWSVVFPLVVALLVRGGVPALAAQDQLSGNQVEAPHMISEVFVLEPED